MGECASIARLLLDTGFTARKGDKERGLARGGNSRGTRTPGPQRHPKQAGAPGPGLGPGVPQIDYSLFSPDQR